MTNELLQLKPSLTLYPLKSDPNYLISKEGVVFSTITNRLLEPYVNPQGYKSVSIKQGNSHHLFLHRMLAETFLDNPENLEEVNHKDGNKLNNDLSNLEWVTGCGNIRHAFTNGLTKSKAICDYSLLDSYVERLLNDPETTFASLSREESIKDTSSIRKLIKRHLLREGKEDVWNELTIAVKRKGRTNKKVLLTMPSGEKILCDSQIEASKFLGVQPSSICLAIKNNKLCAGAKVTHA